MIILQKNNLEQKVKAKFIVKSKKYYSESQRLFASLILKILYFPI